MSGDDVTQIAVGGLKLGLRGWQDVLEQALALTGLPAEEVARRMVDLLQVRNYIPAGVRADYEKACLREYRRARGEEVESEPPGLIIKILGAGCPACNSLTQLVMQVAAELGLPADIEHVTDYQAIAAYGVMSVPALLINGRLVAAGRLPHRDALRQWLLEQIPAEGEGPA